MDNVSAPDANSARRDSNAGGLKAFVSVTKDAISVLRDSMLFLIALLLIFFPTTFNSRLEKAGFEEGSFAGLKWRSKLATTDQALKEANATIEGLTRQNTNILNILNQVRPDLKDASIQKRIETLLQDNTQLNAAAKQVQDSVSSTIASNATLVDKVLLGAGGKLGVVWSGNASLESAKYETNTNARRLGIPHSFVFHRQGSYRSVSVVDEKSQADIVRLKAQQQGSDAYIVNLGTWCPNPQYQKEQDYFECP